MIEIESRNIRLELVHEHSTEIIKKIIIHHFGYNNTLIIECWEAYN